MALVYLQQEDVVNEILVEHHLSERSDTVLTRLLTDLRFVAAYEALFDGIQGAFSRRSGRGTILFWGLSHGRRLPLFRNGMVLQSEGEAIQVELAKGSLVEAIQARRLMPGMALTYIVLAFYYGLRCGGGFSQISYLEEMKIAYGRFLQRIGLSREQDRLSAVEAQSLRAGFMLAELASGRPATTLDLIFRRAPEKELASRALELTVRESIGKMIDAYPD